MDIKRFVNALLRKHHTNDPVCIANALGIILIYTDLKNILGFFSTYKRSKFIHINQNIPDSMLTVVCAHELGHALLHPRINTPFLRQNTFCSIDKIEREANTFAAELLLPDSLLAEYDGLTLQQIALAHHVPDQLTRLKSRV